MLSTQTKPRQKRNKPLLRSVAWLLIFALTCTTGCISNKKLVYIQDDGQQYNKPVTYNAERKTYVLQTGDVLSVSVKGVDQELQNTFNLSSGGVGGAVFADPGSQYVNGYGVDDNGDITLTSVGKVHVKGLTVAEATELCQKRIGNFLKEATVSVKLVSFKITVLGSVNRPGYTFVQNPRCNILEGLGLGGDLTPVANRKRIKLFRQTTQGTEVVLLDLTSPDLLRSPYFYLQPNDVLYVEPLSGQTTRQNYTPVTVVLGIISGIATVILLYYTIKNNQK